MASRASSTSSPRTHVELLTSLGILDFERTARMSGARFYSMLGAGARLTRALIDFMLDLHTGEHGLHRNRTAATRALGGAWSAPGNLPKFEADLFKMAGDWDLYLIPTAEVPLTNLHREETLDAATLPLQATPRITPCFRSEAGSYGAGHAGADPPPPVLQGGAGRSSPRPSSPTTSSSR